MNELQVFKNQEFGSVRTLVINSEPWFVGKDVAEALGYKNTKDALAKHVDSEDKEILKSQNATLENIPNRGVTVVNESGLYSLVLSSKLPSAKKFKRWVTSEVLPALRKTGQYQVKELSGQELMAKALIEAQSVLAAKDKVIEEMKPKADYYDQILQSKSLVLISQIAKDYGLGAPTMNKKLHELGVQYKQGGQWLLYSKYQNKGYTHSRTINITRSDGRSDVRMQTEWTQKGRLFLYELLRKNGILPIIEQNQESDHHG